MQELDSIARLPLTSDLLETTKRISDRFLFTRALYIAIEQPTLTLYTTYFHAFLRDIEVLGRVYFFYLNLKQDNVCYNLSIQYATIHTQAIRNDMSAAGIEVYSELNMVVGLAERVKWS